MPTSPQDYQPTAEEVAQHYVAMLASVDAIAALLLETSVDIEAVARNADHLQYMLTKPYWSIEDMSPFTTLLADPVVNSALTTPLVPDDLPTLKAKARSKIDTWRQSAQGSGYAHAATGVSYGSSDRERSLLVGKIQEMQTLSTASGIFPDINGVPITHTRTEMEAVGLGMASFVEGVYLQAVGLVQQIMDPTVTDQAGIDAILAPVLGA